ncbi:rho GTPase-activating protein gacV-like [Dioscorea cayenensis subsp. rotundata]|uniref:Rho GTPase-activating protein gacV-like n=1 Tax=Dioscorea cayennensis subsp. rotundata TaxID=55577 RepID=A0AB40C0H9_DIOCR|nr:rho GTPase-activating protein gacV-like [Dioscorea cayenensis subsp. rotundata]
MDVWKNEYGCVNHAQVSDFLSGQRMVADDVVDVFCLMLNESLRKTPSVYKRRGIATRPQAFQLSKLKDDNKSLINLMNNPLSVYDQVEVVLIPIIVDNHYHLLVLDKEKKEYLHFSSISKKTYNDAAKKMEVKEKEEEEEEEKQEDEVEVVMKEKEGEKEVEEEKEEELKVDEEKEEEKEVEEEQEVEDQQCTHLMDKMQLGPQKIEEKKMNWKQEKIEDHNELSVSQSESCVNPNEETLDKTKNEQDKVDHGSLKQKFLIFDVNGVLAKTEHKYVTPRPFVEDFLEFCFEHYEVAIWSSKKP